MWRNPGRKMPPVWRSGGSGGKSSRWDWSVVSLLGRVLVLLPRGRRRSDPRPVPALPGARGSRLDHNGEQERFAGRARGRIAFPGYCELYLKEAFLPLLLVLLKIFHPASVSQRGSGRYPACLPGRRRIHPVAFRPSSQSRVYYFFALALGAGERMRKVGVEVQCIFLL